MPDRMTSALWDANCSTEFSVNTSEGSNALSLALQAHYSDCALVLRNGQQLSVCNSIVQLIPVTIFFALRTSVSLTLPAVIESSSALKGSLDLYLCD